MFNVVGLTNTSQPRSSPIEAKDNGGGGGLDLL